MEDKAHAFADQLSCIQSKLLVIATTIIRWLTLEYLKFVGTALMTTVMAKLMSLVVRGVVITISTTMATDGDCYKLHVP